MVTRDGNTITVSFYVQWDDVRTAMDTVLESYERPALVHEFTNEEIDGIMDGIRERIEFNDYYYDNVNVDAIIAEYCEEWLRDNDYIKDEEAAE